MSPTLTDTGSRLSLDFGLTARDAERLAVAYLEARNSGNLDLLDAVYHPSVVVHDCGEPLDIRGLAALKAHYRGSHVAFPDFRMNFDDVFFGGAKLVVRWTVTGTHAGELRGLPPTGRSVRFSGVAVERVQDGRIVEEWVDYNALDLLVQLGVVQWPPAPAPGPGTP